MKIRWDKADKLSKGTAACSCSLDGVVFLLVHKWGAKSYMEDGAPRLSPGRNHRGNTKKPEIPSTVAK